MLKKLLPFCFAVAFVACQDSHNAEANGSDHCKDGAIQYDIIKAKSNLSESDGEVNLTDIYCAKNTVTYVYTIDSPSEIPAMKAKKAEFDKLVKDELIKFFCSDKAVELYTIKKYNMSVKWQYFIKGEKKVFREFSANEKLCKQLNLD